MSLAPIILFTFNRLDHTQKTVEALKQNILADQSELYIFSDDGRNDSEKIIVNEIRDYLKSITGFKKVKIIESEVNKGLAKSVINGVTEIINKYGKVIVLEDDLITSKYFLKYMNESLNLYEKREDIWSISGYSPNIYIPKDYKYCIYLTYRGCSWGWATWKDRWNNIDWEISDYNTFRKNRTLRRKFNISGTDMAPMLDDQMSGRINSWAIRWVYNQFKKDMMTIYPVKSLVRNIGNDLSGTHVAITDKYNTELNQKDIQLFNEIKENKYICDSFKKFYDLKTSGYIAIIIKKIGLYKISRKLRNKILKILR